MKGERVDNCTRHRVTIGKENIYIITGEDGSVFVKFPFENRTENEKLRQYIDAICEKISEIARG